MRLFLAIWLCLISGQIMAQDFPYFGVSATSVLIVDQESLLTRTELGQQILALEELEQNTLIEEGRKIGLQFEQEEQALTVQRDTLPADEFRILAENFDAKVVNARQQQAILDATLLANIEARREAFNRVLGPILQRILRKYRAAAIVDKRWVLAFDPSMDITSEAIALLDAAYRNDPNLINLIGQINE